jgi:hypothetical protein
VIGDHTFSQRHANQALDYEAFMDGRGEKTPSLDINLRSIAEFSGIPRKTVRRKINQFLKLGWASKQQDGSLLATSKAKTDLEPLTLASIRYPSGMIQLFTKTFREETPAKNQRNARRRTRESNTLVKLAEKWYLPGYSQINPHALRSGVITCSTSTHSKT